jgi:hypothetical protein
MHCVKLDTQCPVCDQFDEDGHHLYFKCNVVKRIWFALSLDEVRVRMETIGSTKETIEFILLSLEGQKRIKHILLL